MPTIDLLNELATQVNIKHYYIALSQKLSELKKTFSNGEDPLELIRQLELIFKTIKSAPKHYKFSKKLNQDKTCLRALRELESQLKILLGDYNSVSQAILDEYGAIIQSLQQKEKLPVIFLPQEKYHNPYELSEHIKLYLRLEKTLYRSNLSFITKDRLKNLLLAYDRCNKDLISKLSDFNTLITTVEARLTKTYDSIKKRFSPMARTSFKWMSAGEQWLLPSKRPKKHTNSMTFDELLKDKVALKSLRKGNPLTQILYLNCYQVTMLAAYLTSEISLESFVSYGSIDNKPKSQSELYISHREKLLTLLQIESSAITIPLDELSKIKLNPGDFICFNEVEHVVMATGRDNEVISFWNPKNGDNCELVITTLDTLFKQSFHPQTRVQKVSPVWLPQSPRIHAHLP